MPKEPIKYGERSDVSLEWDEAGQTTRTVNIQEPSLNVRWNRDGQDGVAGFVGVQFDVTPEFIEHVISKSRNGFTVATGLDRKGINHLIRTLRRARDAAYGADE